MRKSKVIPEESEQDDVSMRSIKTEKQERGRGRGHRRAVTPAPEDRVDYATSEDDDQSVLG